MNNVLNESVLVLNRLWLPVNVTTVEEALKQMYGGVAQSIDIQKDESGEFSKFNPTTWDEWSQLPVRENERAVHTPKMTIRAPSIIIANNYEKLPTSTPKLNSKNVGKLYGYKCQYTGEYAPNGNLDHIVPKGLGGKTVWENVTWSKKEINSKKGNRRNSEVGLPEIKGRKPLPSRVPLKVLVNMKPEWFYFVIK